MKKKTQKMMMLACAVIYVLYEHPEMIDDLIGVVAHVRVKENKKDESTKVSDSS